MKLILPVAGKSTRFPKLKPKWLLTHPNGNLMLFEAISQINLGNIEEIIIVSTACLENEYKFSDVVVKEVNKIAKKKISNIILLQNDTSSQSETVFCALQHYDDDFPFFVKDSDNRFSVSPVPGNYVCVEDLNNISVINPQNKSYLSTNSDFIVTNIAEKKVISSLFCVGGYSFSSSKSFCSHFEKYKGINREIYISDVIYSMMIGGNIFYAKTIHDYVDWGTLEDWNRYKSSYATIFIDIDGTLVENSGQFFTPKWGTTAPILENCEIINKLYNSGKVQIILTTSRTEAFRVETESQLNRYNIKYHKIIYGLFHSKRVIINDYANSNPYKSCDALNISRNSKNLPEMLRDIIRF